ncbi:UNVERIFIED_CONTAM: hypothetical protein K2H54_039987 [Gekko kuhli]
MHTCKRFCCCFNGFWVQCFKQYRTLQSVFYREKSEEVIDLTGEDLAGKTAVYHDVEVIDLTQIEDTMVSPLHDGGYVSLDLIHSTPASVQAVYSPKILTTLDPERTLDMSHGPWDRKQPSPKEGAIQTACFQGSFALVPSYSGDSESSSHTTFNSDLGSLGSPQLDSDVFSLSPANDSSELETFQDPVEDDPSSCPPKGDLNPQLSLPDQRHSPSSLFSQCPPNATTLPIGDQSMAERNNSASGTVKLDVQEPVQQIDIKVWMKTLQYFPGVPVHHPFLHSVVHDAGQNKQQKARPIPSRRLSMVSSTIEENFFRGTLDFLMDYVSSQYYPPEKTMQDVVRQILLSSEVQQEIQRDAYMLLMKIQALHPAKADTVVWDWNLLHEVMTEQEEKFPGRLLFLNYVIQTLEDDFQTTARQGILHRSIAKKMLSCDQCFSNLKELIGWLVAAVTGTRFFQHRDLQEAGPMSETSVAKNSISVPELHSARTAQIDLSLHFQSQREVALLQRMLSIAVEVDKSPICSVNKIAEMVFPSVLTIPKRCQREAFLSSMECHLLRCKVLELIFHHSCNKPSCNKPINLPLSMEKILYFLTHLSVPIKYQDNEVIWKRWDEMLHLLNLLVLSYHRIVLAAVPTLTVDTDQVIDPALQSAWMIKADGMTIRSILIDTAHPGHLGAQATFRSGLSLPIPSPLIHAPSLGSSSSYAVLVFFIPSVSVDALVDSYEAG